MAVTVVVCGCSQKLDSGHDYRIYSDSAKGRFLVDAPIGAVWQYQQTANGSAGFVRLPVVNRMEQIDLAFDALRKSSVSPHVYVDEGVLYEVMQSKEEDFLASHPKAQKVETTLDQASDKPQTATNAEGNRIISHDGGKTWRDVNTGKYVGSVPVTAPNGVTYLFPNEDAAAKFRKLAKIEVK